MLVVPMQSLENNFPNELTVLTFFIIVNSYSVTNQTSLPLKKKIIFTYVMKREKRFPRLFKTQPADIECRTDDENKC